MEFFAFKKLAMLLIAVAASVAITSTTHAQNVGTVWAWGNNDYGQLGTGTRTDSYIPVQVPSLTSIKEVASGLNFSLALSNDGTVLAWGRNCYGQLGNGTFTDALVPAQVMNLNSITSIAAGYDFGLALKNDGTLWAWGHNNYGQLGNGTWANSNVPVQVFNIGNIHSITAGALHSVALKTDGLLYAWGDGGSGALGNGSLNPSNTPVLVQAISNVMAVAAGAAYTVVLKSDGTVWAWGSNNYNSLGTTGITYSLTPLEIIGINSVSLLSSNSNLNLTVKVDGTIWGWGAGGSGQLGNGSSPAAQATPVQVINLDQIKNVTSAGLYSFGIKTDGTLWAWGDNSNGQLGNGNATDTNYPIQIISLYNVSCVSGNGGTSLAVANMNTSCSLSCMATAPSTGTPGSSISFSSSATATPSGCITPSFDWDFGDGTAHSTLQNPTHSYAADGTYNWTLAVNGSGVSSCIKSGTIAVSTGSCSLSCTAIVPSTGAPGSSISFSSSAAATPSVCITPSFDWDFGDGTAHSTLQNPTHSYAADGTYNWNLTVSGSGVSSCTKSGTINISSAGCIIECNVSAPTSAAVGTAIYFLSTSTITPSGCTNPVYDWDFGDGTAHSTLQNPDHVYASTGTYTWILTVSGAGATECQLSGTITISEGSQITISGHVMLKGQIGIKGLGDGDFDKVIARDAGGNEVESTTISSDGSYSIALPRGNYTLVGNIHYFDWHLATNDPVIRYSQVKLPNSSYNESRTVDFIFPSPIVFIHGIRSDWKKWNDWILEISTFYPDQIVFTPGYDDGANYEDEANYLYQHLEMDFSKLAVATPDFNVIAHSKGGLVARVFKNYYSGYPLGNAMKDLVMLGTPNNGSDCASLNNIGGCTLYNLCECQVGQLVNVPYPNLSGMGGRVHVVAGTKANALGCTYVVSNCTDTEDSDGIVTAYSVFHTEDSQFGGSYPGIAVPFNHCELGSAETKILLADIIMPYYSSGVFPQCPNSTETTPQIKLCGAGNPTPVFPYACMKGNGYVYGSCTANLPQDGSSSTELSWTAPASDGTTASPSNLTAESTTDVSNCSSGAIKDTDQRDGIPTLLGYQIFRSTDENVSADDSHRIGYVEAGKTGFIDSAPSNSHDYYVVTALYDSGESLPSNVAYVQNIIPPTLNSVSKLTSPFRLQVIGNDMHPDLKVYIGDDTFPWPNVKVKNSSLVIIKGGANLKSKFPKGWQVGITIINGDGGTSTIYYRR